MGERWIKGLMGQSRENGSCLRAPSANGGASKRRLARPRAPADLRGDHILRAKLCQAELWDSGKEYVPEFDGKFSTMREYQRRVRLYESTTAIDDKMYQAGRLVERMTGDAWKATETLHLQAQV